MALEALKFGIECRPLSSDDEGESEAEEEEDDQERILRLKDIFAQNDLTSDTSQSNDYG